MRVHAMPHQQDVAYIVPVGAGDSMIVVMLDVNGDPIERQITCPDCISLLALADITTDTAILHDTNAQALQYWTAQAQCASLLFDGFHQRGPPSHS